MTRLVSPSPDAVSDALRSLSVRSTIFCLSELRAPWAFRVDGEAVAKFHVVLEGSAFLVRPSEEPLVLSAGDLVVLPRGAAHTLAHDHAGPAIALDRILAEHPLESGLRLRYGGDGAVTRILCGGLSLAEALPQSTLAVFPEVLRIERDRAVATAWLEPVLAALTAEAESGLPGASAVVAKLADVFLTQALRAWMVEAGNDGRAGAGLVGDQSIARAVRALDTRSSEAWSLDSLAKHVGLSRTALAVKFREAIGQSPMRYLTTVRLNRAAAYLAAGRLTVHEVAHRTGYQNEATLSKAFKREFGLAPGAYRDRATRLPEVEIA
jgi:AraC-like DNA-binding protein/mannose-6-phosphate isomerase-like protein (cupin superfamily)